MIRNALTSFLSVILVFSSSMAGFSQSPSEFNDLWNNVKGYQENGKPRSAIKEVEKIYLLAETENNKPQITKAILKKLSLMATFEEDFTQKGLEFVDAEMAKSEYPIVHILQSVKAELLWSYFEQNRYRILERENLEGERSDDIITWSYNDFANAVNDLYLNSLNEELKDEHIKRWNPILITGKDRKYRPTLYDFLAFRALDHFSNPEAYLNRSVNEFILDDSHFLSQYDVFLSIDFFTENKNAAWRYMKIMKDLMAFHVEDDDLSAFIDVDLKRLEYAYSNGTFEGRDSLYLNQLMRWFDMEDAPEIVAEAGLLVAKLKYNSLKEEGCYLCEVKEICEAVIKRFPKSNSVEEAKKIIKSIEAESIAIQIPEIVPSLTEELALVTVKNINTIYLRVVELNFDDHPETLLRGRMRPQKPQIYFQKKTIKNWEYSFEIPQDFQEHSLEIALPALPYGYYAILVSPSEEFTIDGVLSFAEFTVSDMHNFAVKAKNDNNILVTSGVTGRPIPGVSVSLFKNEYRHGIMLLDEGETDEAGQYPINFNDDVFNAYAIFKNGDDILISSVYGQDNNYGEREHYKTWIFTDRAIYRPGHTVRFKAITVRKEGESADIASNKNIPVSLMDINYQIRDEVTLKSNDYGTVNGTFLIPNDIPTGMIKLKTPFGSKSIQVEEYKRPTFEIDIHDIETKANETDPYIVSGKVNTFSGLPVDGAEVKYRVTRSSYLPWRWWWRPFNDDIKEIALGTLTTDSEGAFNFQFEASPRKIKRDFFGYTYTVTATVTDQAGETHEEKKSVIDAVRKIAVKTDLPEWIFSNQDDVVNIEIINNLEEIEKCNGVVKIEKLEVPDRVYRDRLWHQDVDVKLFEQDDFQSRFPLDYYDSPIEYSSLQAEKRVMSNGFANGKITLDSSQWKNWNAGVYRLTVEGISGQDTASLKKEFIIINPEKEEPAEKKIFEVYRKERSYDPGEEASFIISSAKQLEVVYLLNNGKEVLERRTILLNNSMKEITIPILKEYRGNVFVQLFTNLNGRVYQQSFTIKVPRRDKVLEVEFVTFRNETEPGSEESWTLKVQDYKGNPVQSEMLLTMYDRALDAFAPHTYLFSPFSNRYSMVHVESGPMGLNNHRFWNANAYYGNPLLIRDYDKLIWSPSLGYQRMGGYYQARGNTMPLAKGMEIEESLEMVVDEDVDVTTVKSQSTGMMDKDEAPEIELRTDFSETAFFYPVLRSKEDGIVEISFKAPQSITGWKVLGLAHTKDLKSASFENELVTQKEIMISPNMPRFVRQGDIIILQARINSLMEDEVSVETFMELFDPESEESLNYLIAGFNRKVLNIGEKGSVMVEWELEIPDELSAIGIRTYAKTDKHTDGEEYIIPVLPSQTLVTESLPVSIDGNGTHEFTFDHLIEKGADINNFALTLEFTANPAWYAVQALPFLEENNSKSAVAIFDRYYANSLASYIANYNPQIKRIFDQWRNQSPEALLSALEKNKALKTTLLQESPWLAEAKDETVQKRRIALLFDLNRISRMKSETWNMLSQMQNSDGSWSWYEGMKPSPYTTLSIVENSARLYYLGVEESVPYQIIQAAKYLDKKAKEEYEEILQRDDFKEEGFYISNFAISWLYARSLLGDNINSVIDQDWYEYYFSQIKENWTNFGLYQQSLAAIILYFNVEPEISEEIIESLKERAMYSDKLGMYWRELHSSPYWYSAPIPTMASLIEAFSLMGDNGGDVRQMKKWLLTQKQTNCWSSDIGTVHAIYALLLQGEEMLSGANDIELSLGGNVVVTKEESKEPGTGYIRKTWHGKEISPKMGTIEVTTTSDQFSWGALHWQYYMPYSDIESAGNGLTITRKLFLKENTEQGPVLKEIEDQEKVKTGERIVVRMEVTADRDYSFVHLKDQRTAAFEPVENRSGYQWKNGVGFYLSIRDASVNYFFDHLKKGNYTFEYELFKVRTGDYTGGLSTIQCVYAPEFNAHSEGN